MRTAFAEADWDGSGWIEYEEFERVLMQLRERGQQQHGEARNMPPWMPGDSLSGSFLREGLDKLPALLSKLSGQGDAAVEAGGGVVGPGDLL